MTQRRRAVVSIGIGIWAILVLAILYGFSRYESTPGKLVLAGPKWPNGSLLKRSDQKPTLILFAHPQCTCTLSALDNLDRTVSGLPGRAKVYVVFADVPGIDNKLLSTAKRIPDTEIYLDRNQLECKRFQVYTSGTAVLYSTSGVEIFRGGLTGSRGHEGPSSGLDAIEDYLKSGVKPIREAPVFGCALFTPTAQEVGR